MMSDTKDFREIIMAVTVGLVFVALFLSLAVPVTDPDFWWHLASGKWIVEHGSLMNSDPFTIDSPFKRETAGRFFTLKQYWLSQIFFYITYASSGLKGVILQTAAVFTLMFFAMYRLTIKTGVHRAVALALLYLAFMVIVKEFAYIGARPQMWSSLFSVVVVWLLEELKQGRKWAHFGLPALMLLWANMHGGFVLGAVIILCYVSGALVSKTGTRPFYLASFAAILISGVNPNGFSVLSSAPLLGPLLVSLKIAGFNSQVAGAESISELKSIFAHTSLLGIVKGLPYFTTIFLLSLSSFIACYVRTRRVKTEYLLLFALVFLMACTSIRFIIFFTTIASFITAMNLKGIIDSLEGVKLLQKRRVSFFTTLIIALLISAKLGIAGFKTTDLFSDTAFEGTYKQAADFVSNNKIKGYIFNDYNAGGYLLWRLAATNRIFIDGRVLYGELFDVFRSTVDSPFTRLAYNIYGYRRTLDFFGIDIVMLPGCDEVSGTLIKLVPALLNDPDWALVYADDHALVFVRHSEKNEAVIRANMVPKVAAYRNIYGMALGASQTGHAARMVNWKLSVAFAYAGAGEYAKALPLITEYLKKMPDDQFAVELQEKITAGLAQAGH